MRASLTAASPSARPASAPAPSPDNSGASSAPSSSLPDLEAVAEPPLDLGLLKPALEAGIFLTAHLLRLGAVGGALTPTTSTSDPSPMDESDDTSRSAASGFFRSAGAAVSYPASPSGRGAGDQNSRTFSCIHKGVPSWLQPSGCPAYEEAG